MKYRRYLRLGPRDARELRQDLSDEIAAHIALRAADLERQGMDAAAARAEAERRFGDVVSAERDLFASARAREGRLRRGAWLDDVRRDLLMTWRSALRSPAQTLFRIGTYALAIALATLVYTAFDHVLLRPLPFPESDRMVALHSAMQDGSTFPLVSSANWLDWRERNRTLGAMAIYDVRADAVRAGDVVERARVIGAGGEFFDVMRPAFVWGRPFTEAEAQAQSPVVVVTESMWRRLFGGVPVAGRQIVRGGTTRDVIGVIRDDQAFPYYGEVWQPIRYLRLSGDGRNNINYHSVARLQPGATIEQADRDLDRIAGDIRRAEPIAQYSWGVGVYPLRAEVAGEARTYLPILMGAVAFLVLAACANIASLNIAITQKRTEELTVRAALGAGRRRLVQQLLTEQVAIALAGGAAALFLCFLVAAPLLRRLSTGLPRANEIAIDLRIVAFSFGAALLAGLIAGVWPAVRMSAHALGAVARSGRGMAGGYGKAGSLLIGAEVAVALVLVVGSMLLVRSMSSLLARDLGFRQEDLLTAVARAPQELQESAAARLAFWDRQIEQTRAAASVTGVAVAMSAPPRTTATGFIELEREFEERPGAGYNVISDDYFQVLGIPLLAGRTFDAQDGPNSPRVTIVNRRMAEKYWPGENPIGQRVRAISMESYRFDPPAPWLTVIGVVGDVRHYGYESDGQEQMYVVYRQVPAFTDGMMLVVRAATGRATAVATALERRLREEDLSLVPDVAIVEQQLLGAMGQRRGLLAILSVFSALSVLLCAFGVYALLSFMAVQRTREIGIRAALGAQQSGLLRLMLAGALRIVAMGAAAGLLGAWWLTRVLESMLVDVAPRDPVSFLLAAMMLFGTASAAALIPSWRAARLDPLAALRG